MAFRTFTGCSVVLCRKILRNTKKNVLINHIIIGRDFLKMAKTTKKINTQAVVPKATIALTAAIQTPQISIFTSEEFGNIRTVTKDGEPMFCLADVCKALAISNVSQMKTRLNQDGVITNEVIDSLGRKQNATFINESNLYKTIFQSRKESAERFTEWVTAEVLPTIRKTGGYVLNDELFINEYLPFADDTTKLLFHTTLQTIRNQNNLLAAKDQTISDQQKDLDHKQEVIYNLTDEITVSDKRQILNRIMRHHNGEFQDRWYLLYREFDSKYNMNVNKRLENYNKKHTPKIKSKLDYIDKVLGQLNDLYDLAAKLYESDVNELINQLYRARGIQPLN